MSNGALGYPIAELFPFYLEVDSSLVVRACGISAHKLFGQTVVGCPADDLIDLSSDGQAPSFSQILESVGEQLVFHLKQTAGRLCGQAHPLAADRLALLVVPSFDRIQEMRSVGLCEADFAPHGSFTDSVLKNRARTLNPQEQAALTHRVQRPLREPHPPAEFAQGLNRNRAVAGDLRIRIQDGRIANLAINHPSLAPLASEIELGACASTMPEWLAQLLPQSPWLGGVISEAQGIRVGGQTHNLELCASGDPRRSAIIVGRDVTEEHPEKRLLFQALEHALDAVLIANQDYRIVFANRAAESMFAYRREQLVGESLDFLCVEGAGANLSTIVGGDIKLLRRDCTQLTCHVSTSRVPHGERELINVFLQDVTERRATESRLAYQASHDSLTGLANRAQFMQILERLFHRRKPLAIALIDIDDFKAINDLHGHAAGDEYLCRIADRIQRTVRHEDVVCRLGGDEFAIILADVTGAEEAKSAAHRLLGDLCAPLKIAGAPLVPRASVGVVVTAPGHIPSDALRHADLAMYQAKARGKNQVALFTESMQREVLHRIETQQNLFHAIERDEIRAYYQPIVDLETGKPVALEALARWETAEGQLVSPEQFIELAEQSDLVVRIGESVLSQAIDTVRVARTQWPDMCVNVNFSARHFLQPNLIVNLDQVLRQADLPPSALTLELTESMLLADQPAARERLAALRGLGLRIALDDFGTGYSSLSYLDHFRFDLLKIDKSFVRGLASRSVRKELAQTILAVGGIIGIDVVAEGIEEACDEAVLREMRCRYGQGFFYAKPMTREAVHEYLTEQRARYPSHPGRRSISLATSR